MTDHEKDSLAATIARYSSSHIYRYFLGAFTAFIKPKLLSPQLFGLWNLLSIIPNYSEYLHLGANDVMKYRVPFHLARKEDDAVAHIEVNSYYGALFMNLLVVAGLLVFLVVYDGDLASRAGILVMAVLVLQIWYYDFHIDNLKARQNFRLVSSANYLRTTIGFITTVTLIYFFGIYGLYAAMLLTFFATIFYVRSRYRVVFRAEFRFSSFFSLVRTGFPIMSFGIITDLIISCDQIIISYFLGLQQLGYYGITKMFVEFLMQIPQSSREVVEPKLMEKLSGESGKTILEDFLFKPLYNTAYYMPLIIGPVIFLLPVVIPLILPKYTAGVEPTQIIAIGCYFLGLAFVTRGIIVAHKWHVEAAVLMVPVLLVNLLLSTALIKAGYGINGVAVASSFSYFILFVALLSYIRRRNEIDFSGWGRMILGFCLPFPVMCLLVVALPVITDTMSVNKYVQSLINVVLYGIFVFVFIVIAQKVYPILARLPMARRNRNR